MSTSRTFRIFVSSTFNDLKAERNALQERVFPRLRELAESHGVHFQAIDLRWGVSDQASLDQQAMNICLQEIKRCQDTSPRPNFIVLLGDRYGWMPPPSRILETTFNHIKNQVKDPGDMALLDRWYQLDNNALDPEYRLVARQRGGPYEEYEDWEPVETRLQAILEKAVDSLGLSATQRIPFTTSATEQEIVAGAFQVKDADDHVHCFFREIQDLPQGFSTRAFLDDVRVRLSQTPPKGISESTQDNHLRSLAGLGAESTAKELDQQVESLLDGTPKGTLEYSYLSLLRERLAAFTGKDFQNLSPVDWRPDKVAHNRQVDLKARLETHVPTNTIHYPAQWTGRGITTSHIDQLCEDVYNALSKTMLAEIENPTLDTSVDAAQVRVESNPNLDEEGLAHHAFAQDRLQFFVGRDIILEAIKAYLKGTTRETLAINGKGGTGKSALVAKALQQAQAHHSTTEIVYRFIGVTPASGDGRSLLDSLCREISRRYGVSETDIPLDYRELVPEFGKRLALATGNQPLILFLDSLDQLSPQHNARSLTWLPNQLPANVHLVVTTRPEDTLKALQSKGHQQLELGGLDRKEGQDLLNEWLEAAGRTLQGDQNTAVLDQFMNSEGAPLYLKLAFEEARLWPSGDGTPPEPLEPGIKGIIKANLIDRLADESSHGKILVAKVLGYLGASRYGLAEDEMVDLLSRDLGVYRWFLEASYHLPADLVKWAAIYLHDPDAERVDPAYSPSQDEIKAATDWLNEMRNPPDNLLDFLGKVLPQPKGPRLPVVLWSRLSFDLEPYLSERASEGATLLTFYHRELGEVAREVYLAGGKDLPFHENLGDYFRTRSDPKGDQTWTGGYPRGLSELPYHLTKAARWDEVFETLTDFQFLEHKAAEVGVMENRDSDGNLVRTYTGVYQLQEDYERALGAMPGGDGATGDQPPLIITAQQRGEALTVYCPACNQTSKIEKGQLDKIITCPQPDCDRKLKLNPFVTRMG
jgi:hypothetical protein